MRDIKQAFWIAGQNFYGWKKSPRIWMTFILAAILCLMLSDQIISHAIKYETILQVFEPFIWTYGDASSVMLSSLLLILLFADMPFISQATPYWLVRTKRKIWLAGQIIYVILATVIYNIFLAVMLGIMGAPFSFTGNVWSETAAMLGYGGGESITVPVSIKTMESSTPYMCAAIVFGLVLLYTLFIAVLMLFLNLAAGNMAGVIGAFAVSLYGLLLNPDVFRKLFHFTESQEYRANVFCGWLSPLNQATFPMHSFGYDYLPGIGMSMFIFAILIIALIGLSAVRINDSSFLWMEGSNFIEEETIETEEMQSEYYSSFGMDTNGYTEKFHELADAYRKCMDKITFTEEDGKEQAEQVLEDLGIDGMGLVDSDRTVWFPNGACSERNGLGLGSDALWQGDLDRGLPGYLYCFSKSVEGITSVPDGVVAEETVDSYVPPFQVETISILITEEGIKYFKWDGISEEVCTVTENTKLLPFEKIQAKLTDQIFYWYSGKGQSANDTTALEYDVVNAKLQYTYTTAYQEPKHAWLVPAWIFTVRESIGGNSLQELSYVINAYDGSVIGEAY